MNQALQVLLKTIDITTKDIIIFYHRVDLDGHSSGAIVKYFFLGQGVPRENITMYGINYREQIQDLREFVSNKIVVMVDFSLSREDMITIQRNAKYFIWIDHHKNVVEENEDLDLPGIRSYDYPAACVLTYYYFISSSITTGITFLSEYDSWHWHDKPGALEYQYGLRTYDTDPVDDSTDMLWKNIIEKSDCENLISEGATILRYIKKQDVLSVRSRGFITEIDSYKALVVNNPGLSSFAWELVQDEYPDVEVFAYFSWTKEAWRISLRRGHGDVDVSAIARKFKGNGHVAAAGCMGQGKICSDKECDHRIFDLPFQLS